MPRPSTHQWNRFHPRRWTTSFIRSTIGEAQGIIETGGLIGAWSHVGGGGSLALQFDE
jgi:hypothetical protein